MQAIRAFLRNTVVQRFWPWLVLIVPAAMIGVLLLWPYALATVYLSAASYDELRTGIRFDRVLWQDPELVHGQDPIRIHMIDDLLACYELRGLTRDEITQLLGEPDGTKRFATWNMVYWLGPERGFISIDSEWLVLGLDGDGTVVAYDVISD